MRRSLLLLVLASTFLSQTACSTASDVSPHTPILNTSGTIIISGSIPKRDAVPQQSASKNSFAPLLGYARSNISYHPANNEFSVAISRRNSLLEVKLGDKTVESVEIDGALYVEPGSYVLERKELNPSWYAPSEYFTHRNLEIPFAGDAKRFLRGALGKRALFSSAGLTLHSSPIWTPEVGGIRVEDTKLANIFENVSVGTVIVVE